MEIICKLFNFLLNLFDAAITTVGYALKTVGTVLVDTVTGVVNGVADGLLDGGIATWLLLGFAGWFVVTRLGKDEQDSTVTVQGAMPINSPYAVQGE